jgi:hypothetical protein
MSKALIPVVVSYTTLIDPAEMSRRGRIGAHVTHSRHDSRQLTARAREALLAKYEREVDPDGILDPEERRRRAAHARRAHLARIGRLGTIARARAASSASEAANAAS